MVCLAWGKGKGEGEGEGEGERESAMAPPLLPSGLRAADVVRLMAQCIHEMGYTEVAQSLEEHAGVKALAEPVAAFRHAILNGDWCVRSLPDRCYTTATVQLRAIHMQISAVQRGRGVWNDSI
mmetsp:Transcript_9669/g.29471  ORF Transcript_9669/g.29471 Transcript_9669/m.29471 type:complete len:123 (-) Transcript_9669:2692-3060(-)